MNHWSASSTVILPFLSVKVQVYAAHSSRDHLLPGSHGTSKTKGERKISISSKELWFLGQNNYNLEGLCFPIILSVPITLKSVTQQKASYSLLVSFFAVGAHADQMKTTHDGTAKCTDSEGLGLKEAKTEILKG